MYEVPYWPVVTAKWEDHVREVVCDWLEPIEYARFDSFEDAVQFAKDNGGQFVFDYKDHNGKAVRV